MGRDAILLTPGPLTTSLRTKARDALHGKDRPVALHAAHAVMAALLEALRQFDEEGGQPARLARCTDNCRTLVDGLTALGLKPFLRPEVQAPIIVTWHAPDSPHYEFKRFYEATKRRGFLIYPGKLTQVETFRVGCIGAIGSNEMQQAVNAVGESLREMGLAR